MHPRKLCLLVTLALVLVSSAAAAQTVLPGSVRLLVMPFEVNAGPDLAYLADDLPKLIGDRLREKGFQVGPHETILKLIESENVSYLDVATVRDLSLLAEANVGVYGSFSQVGETLSIDARVVDAFGQRPPKPVFVVREGLINILPAVDELVERIAAELVKQETIAAIEVRGAKVLDDDVVLMRLGVQKGDPYNPGQLSEEMKRVYELGYFEDVQVLVDDLPEGKRVIFQVEEKPRVQAITVEGNEELDDEDVLAVMSTKTGGVLNPSLLAEDLGRIRELYKKEGFYLAEVEHEVVSTEDLQSRLVIKVVEGQELYITDVRIKGAEALDEDDVKDELALAERGALSWITGSGVLRQELLERDTAAIEAYYANRGFMDVRVAQPEVTYGEEGISIVFTVEEGPRYKVGEILFRGDLLEAPEALKDLTAMDDLKAEEEFFNRSTLRDDAQALTDHYTNYGYAFAETDTTINKNDNELTIDVTYFMAKNQLVRIRRVTLEGNTKTRDNVIRRNMDLADGDVFSGKGLRRSSEKLTKLDFFETVDLETVPTGDPGALDLKVKVKEKSTGMITGGVGYSSSSRFFVSGKVLERNLFGLGYYLGFSGAFSGDDTLYNLSFFNPSVWDTKLGWGLDAYIAEETYNDFDKETQGGRVKFSYPIGEYSRLFWNYRLDFYTLTDIGDDASDSIREHEGDNISSVIELAALRDSTNRRMNPSSGSVNKLSLEHGGGVLGGDDDYIKTVFETNWFWEPFFEEHVLHLRGQFGYLFENFGGDVPVFERFYLGGINTIRGYPLRHVAPIDSDTEDFIGGNKSFFSNVEYIFPLESEFGLLGLVFFDIGNAWEEDNWNLSDLKKSVGGGLRWFSPFGPLRLEYGYALNEVYDQGGKHKVEFSVGQGF